MRISPSISPRNLRIASASLIAVLMVTGGYILPGLTFPETKAVNAELTDDLLASYVAKDTDTDGLPDWQEVLYGTDAAKADTDGDGISDGEAVRKGLLTPTSLASQIPTDPIGEEDIPGEPAASGSITDQFAQAFFEAYIKTSGGQPLSEEAQQQLVARLVADFSSRAAKALTSSYTTVSIRRSTTAGVLDYVSSVESILKRNEVAEGGGNPVLLMQALIEDNDETARPKLKTLAASYAAIKDELLSTPVPPQLIEEHLGLVRSFDSLGKATLLVANYEKDPLGVLGALTIYQPSSQGVVTALQGMATEILLSGEPQQGMPGYYIVNFVRYAQQL